MKCEMPRCRRELNPNDTYETDVGGVYRRICKKCYEKATVQARGGAVLVTEGQASKVVASQLALAW